MKLCTAWLLVLFLAPSAIAETTSISVGDTNVSIATNDVPDCVVTAPGPCPLGYDANGTLAPMDDTVYLNKSVDKVSVVSPVLPVKADVDLDSTRVNHTTYATLQDGLVAAHDALPAPLRGVVSVTPYNDRNTYIGYPGPELNGTNVTIRMYTFYGVGIPYTDRNGTTLPNGFGTDDTDAWVPAEVETDAGLCYVPELGGPDALVCGVVPVQPVVAAWPALTPRIVTQFQVHDVQGGPTGNVAPSQSLPSEGFSMEPGTSSQMSVIQFEVSKVPHATGPVAREAPLAMLTTSTGVAVEPLSSSVSVLGRSEPSWTPWAVAAVAIAAPILLLYHRIIGRKAMQHKHRARIHELVGQHPGLDVSALGRELGLSFKSTAHHVSVLQRGGYVQVRRQDRRVLVFRMGEEREALRTAALRHASRRRIVEELRASPGLRQADLARRLGTTRSVVHAHVRVLVECGVVTRHGARLHLSEAPVPRLPGHLVDLAAAAAVLSPMRAAGRALTLT